ncbi:hypothetical protein TWF696_005048 [Orbilia brochopaga]|uniref:DMAP1-binding domain-containing protein n=1 Tax=Orbilia brochopaga TaxID=3140254 RepID=A0AAV9V2B2_9PEZI
MESAADLQQKLAELDHELEDGEITQKGYEKRRTLLLSQFQTVTTSSSSSPRASIQSASTYNPHHSISSLNRSPAPAPSPASFQAADSPRPNRYSLLPGQSPVGAYDRNDTMVSSVSGFSAATGTPLSTTPIPRSFSQPLQPHQWHHRNSSGGSAAAHARQASYSSYPQQPGPGTPQQPAYVQPMYQPQGPGPEYAYNNGAQGGYDPYYGQQPPQQQPGQYGYDSRAQTMAAEYGYEGTNTMTSTTYFADFSQQGYDPASQQGQLRPDSYQSQQPYVHRYSGATGDPPYSPAANAAPPLLTASDLPPAVATNHMMPLEPRDVPFDVYDPHNDNIPMSKFDNIAAVLRHRMRTNGKQAAYMVLDSRGKEIATCTWEKLGSRAEKVAQVIREKSNLYRGDRVALIYRDIEVIDFAIALLGCFIAGVVAVPVNNPEDHSKLNLILQQTQAHLALTTDNNLKAFQRDLTNQKLQWPRGVEWWKTNEFKSFHAKGEVPALQVPDLAYIEFSRAPTGDLRGVVMDHRTIMHQMSNLSAIISTTGTQQSAKDTFAANLRDRAGRPIAGNNAGETLVTYLDPRQSIGMIMGVLLAVYGGHTTVYCTHSCISTPGLYANIITRYKATLILADYPGLKQVAYNYQQDPYTTRNFSKKQTVDFSHMKLCLIDCLTVDPEFHEILSDRWLRPLGNGRARDVVAPMLCLPEHGGMLISIRDWLGGEERMGCALVAEVNPGKDMSPGGIAADRGDEHAHRQSDLLEALLDKEALKTNDVVIVAVGAEARRRANEAGVVRLMAFGYPIPDATMAVVDPENSVLCGPNTIGEIWVDSPSLSGGFWALPKHTETIFHARPYRFEAGNPLPVMLDMEFLRTGLLGCVIEGKVFVLGLYEDRLRQKVEWSEGNTTGEGGGGGRAVAEYRYFFVQHIIVSIIKNVPKIYDRWVHRSVSHNLVEEKKVEEKVTVQKKVEKKEEEKVDKKEKKKEKEDKKEQKEQDKKEKKVKKEEEKKEKEKKEEEIKAKKEEDKKVRKEEKEEEKKAKKEEKEKKKEDKKEKDKKKKKKEEKKKVDEKDEENKIEKKEEEKKDEKDEIEKIEKKAEEEIEKKEEKKEDIIEKKEEVIEKEQEDEVEKEETEETEANEEKEETGQREEKEQEQEEQKDQEEEQEGIEKAEKGTSA